MLTGSNYCKRYEKENCIFYNALVRLFVFLFLIRHILRLKTYHFYCTITFAHNYKQLATAAVKYHTNQSGASGT